MIAIAAAILLTGITVISSASSISSVTTCSCLGQTVTLQCTAVGGAFTVWAGSAFMCQGGEISLRHVRFLDSIGACNDRAIVARGVSVQNNHYISHINVTLNSELVGRTVTCSLDDGIDLIPIGAINLALNATNMFLPPSEVYLLDIEPNEITFGWSTIPHDGCLSFNYIINSINCGICSPVVTTSNTSTCTNFSGTLRSSTNHVCNFSVQGVICGNITGDMTVTSINLKVPDIPAVQSVAHYDFRANLIELEITIFTVNSFNISDDPRIDGSANSYTITYAESTTGENCHSDTITASSCEDEMCRHLFDVSSSLCPPSTDITVTVVASNILGNSGSSTPFHHDGINRFVEVVFDSSALSIQCLFLTNTLTDNEKYCTVNVTYGNNCDQFVGIYRGKGTSNSVDTPLQLSDDVSEYCLFVNATINNMTVIIEERLNLLNIGGINITIGVTIGAIVLVIMIAVVVTAAVLVYIKTKNKHPVVVNLRIVTENVKHKEYFTERCQAVQALKESGCHPYPHKFTTTHTLKEFHSKFCNLPSGEHLENEIVSLAGRIYAKRESGKLIFYDIQHMDETKVQIMADASYHSDQDMSFEKIHKNLKRGDIVGVKGFPKKTNRGELSVVPKEIKLLSPCLHMVPKQHFGLKNPETRYRQRYLDLIVNNSVQEKFQTRAKIMSFVRKFLDNEGFLEVETPMMNLVAGGASARPFITHHNEFKQDVYLRVAPELYHKMLVVGGLERVYEIGRVFRNEGIDTTHNPEFTACEFYLAYADYKDLMELTEKLLSEMVMELKGTYEFDYTIVDSEGGHHTETVDCKPPFDRIRVIPELKKHLKNEKFPPSSEFTSIKFKKFLEDICTKHRVECAKPRTSARMLDKLIDHFILKNCIKPTFVIDHPQIMSPLAKWHRDDEGLSERFELIVCKQEICNAYTELNDPIKQREMFQQQAMERKAGDSEAQEIDEDFCKALEYGLPPTAGWGMGIDRMAMLLTNSSNIKEVVFFPAMKPKKTQDLQINESARVANETPV